MTKTAPCESERTDLSFTELTPTAAAAVSGSNRQVYWVSGAALDTSRSFKRHVIQWRAVIQISVYSIHITHV